MVTWILESNVFSEACFDAMIAHLNARSISNHVVRIIPFVHEVDGPIPEIDDPVVAYGSVGMRTLVDRQCWSPGVFSGSFSCEQYKASLGSLYFNADAEKMRLSEVEAWLRRARRQLFFIRPDGDGKEFPGEVLEDVEFIDWVGRLRSIGYLRDNDFDVIVASSKGVGREWRVIVVDGTVVAGSLYRVLREPRVIRDLPSDVVRLVNQAHERFAPAPVYVVDVVDTRDDLKVLEYNTFNHSGLYACDVGAIIDSVNAYVERTR